MKQRIECICMALFLLWICAEPGYAAGFADVPQNSAFYDAINWAVEQGITNGTTRTTFSPSQTCTRQHILTFLWRYKNRPSVSWDGFADAPTNGDFRKAANWAYVNGLETGTQTSRRELLFQGGQPCTRAAAVTYLWMLSNRPAVDEDYAHQFTDVGSGITLSAVAWAVKNGITKGTTASTFSPEATCTRGQIVTFLYRYSQK